MKTFIIGHTKPDLDTVVSAMALENLYRPLVKFGYTDLQAVICDTVNRETEFVFQKFGVNAPPELMHALKDTTDQPIAYILVDHNENSQRHPEISDHQVVEIIDHHKLNLNIEKPIFVTTKPWGSTTTIIWWLHQKNSHKIKQPLAALMLCAILSDTVGFKSSTTTPIDREAGQDLAQVAQIDDVDALTLEIFKAKSILNDLSPTEIVTNDYKVFSFGEKKVLISQIETVEQSKIIAQKQALVSAMKEVKIEKNIDHIFVAVSDILDINTKLLVSDENEAEIVRVAFKVQDEHGVFDIGSKLSRKKEIAPAIEKAVTQG